MLAMYQNGSFLGRRLRTVGVSLLALTLAAGAAHAQQQDEEPMDGIDAASLTCEDGTKLQALFDENSVEVTLASGETIKLPAKDGPEGFLFTNGKYSLSGDDETVRWAVGKKAAVTCEFDDQPGPSHFDEPLTVDNQALPADKANPDAQPQVNCYRYTAFAVKEVDLGEKGAESLAITKPDAACERAAGQDEKPVKDETAGYFFGAKGRFVFFQAADGSNGGLPFVVYDSQTGQRLFEDSLAGNDFDSLEVTGDTIRMTFPRVYSADCSLYLDGQACAESIRKATGLGEVAQLPDCGAAYDEEKKRTPDYAKEIEQLPSVITYEAQLTYEGGKVTVVPLKGETSCNVPS